jgi:signal transduction histidine kinase/ligand-binding sensor domain-containing protein
MVSRVIQDSHGLIWMTTGDGLHYFDGKKFKAFRVPIDGVYTHTDNLMRDLIEGSPGILTISTSSSLLNFNTSTGKFSIAFRKDNSYPVLFDPSINYKPTGWIKEIKFCLVGDDRIIRQNLIFETSQKLPENFIPKHAIRSKSGELLIYNESGMLIITHDKENTGSNFRAKWMPIPFCQALATDRNGRMFILKHGTIYEYFGTGEMKILFNTRLSGNLNLFIDSKNNFWITNQYNQLYRISDGALRQIKFRYQDGMHIDSISSDVRSVFEDNHNNIWFGTDGHGVLLYSPGAVRFNRSDIGFTRCLTWFNNEIWAGTYNNGLWRITPDLSRSRQVYHKGFRNGIYFLDMTVDRKGRLWIATTRGLEVLDQAGHTIFKQALYCSKAKLIPENDDTLTFFCDTQLRRYISGDDIYILQTIDFVPVSTFLCTGDAFWIGNQYGLYRGMKKSGYHKNCIFKVQNQLANTAVYSLIVYEGNIWAATSNGIEIFGQDGKQKKIPVCLKELQNEIIYSLLPDDMGRIWFTCNHGMGCINLKHQGVVYFNMRNNLQSLEFNSNAACRTPDGKLYFGGIHGINGFDPAWFNPRKTTSKVRLISLMVSDSAYSEGIPPDSTSIILDRKAPHISGRVFSADYTYSYAGSQVFSFLLDGYPQSWSKPSPDAEFNYRNLPYGKYRLLVKCADPWLNWSKPVTLLVITHNPPVWKTGWFLLVLVSMITLVTAYVARKLNSIRYKRRIHILEQQSAIENERLRISKDMHDDLGASLTRISILSELAKKQQHDPIQSRQIIEQISDISGNVVDDMSEIIWAMNPRNDTFDSFTSYIRQYTLSYLESAGIDGQFLLPESGSSLPMTSELRRNLFLTVKEALHNIVKHSGAHKVYIKLQLTASHFQINIIDDGKGFSVEETKGWGNGLINMRKRMEDLGGRFDITSGFTKGTTIELSVFLPDYEKSH